MKKVVYFTKQYQAVPALMPLYDRLDGAFVSTRSATLKTIQRNYPEVKSTKFTEKLSRFSKGYHKLREASVIVTGSPNQEILQPLNAKQYMVFHGTYAFMSQRDVDAIYHFDHLCVIGPRMAEYLDGKGFDEKIIHSGYLPFMDFPVRDEVKRAAFLESIGLDPNHKTILYLPRGKPNGSWHLMAEKLIRETPPEFNVILRPHPNQSVSVRLKDKIGYIPLMRLSKKRGNALIDRTSCQLSTLFSIADVVVTDGASSPEEAMFYDVPLVFVESAATSAETLAKKMKGNFSESYIQKLLTIYECGSSITPDTSSIGNSMIDALESTEKYKKQREQYFKWVFGERGLDRQNALIKHIASRNLQ